MDKFTKATGRLKWTKTTRGWSCTFDTAFGPKTICTQSHDKRAAVKLAQRAKIIERQAVRFESRVQAAFISGRSVRFDTALEEWAESCKRNHTLQERTIRGHVISISAWLRFCGLEKDLTTAATEFDVSRWINEEGELKASTRLLRLSVLRSFFDWLVAGGYTVKNPARIVTKPDMSKLSFAQKETKHKQPFTDEQIATLLSYIQNEIDRETRDLNRIDEMFRKTGKGYDMAARIERLKFWGAAVMIGRWTGLRLGDVAGLERDSLTKPGVLCVWTDKKDRRVEIPISLELTDTLWKIRTDHPRFVFPVQQKINASPQRATLCSQFRDLLDGAGIKDRSFHCLRCACAIDLLDRLMAAGKTREEAERIVADTLGHKSVTTTRESYLNGGKSL